MSRALMKVSILAWLPFAHGHGRSLRGLSPAATGTTEATAGLNGGVYTLRNVNSGMYLAVAGSSVANSDNVVIANDPNRHESHWEIQVVSEGIYAIKNLGNNAYLSVAGDGSGVAFWTNVQTKGWNHHDVWELKHIQDDIYAVKNPSSDMFVNVLGGWHDPNSNVHMWDNWYSTDSQWHIAKLQDTTDHSNLSPTPAPKPTGTTGTAALTVTMTDTTVTTSTTTSSGTTAKTGTATMTSTTPTTTTTMVTGTTATTSIMTISDTTATTGTASMTGTTTTVEYYYCLDGAGGNCYDFNSAEYPNGNWDTSKFPAYTNDPNGFEAYCASWGANGGTYNGGSGTCAIATAESYHCFNGAGGECYDFNSAEYPNGNWDTSKFPEYTNDSNGFRAYCASWGANGGTYNGGSGICDMNR